MRQDARAVRVVLALTLLAAVLARANCSHARRLLIRPFPGVRGSLQCRNTLTGPFMYADDVGMLCSGKQLDFKTGCCRGGDKHACSACEARDQCCEGYEACVSCCLSPDNNPKARLPEVTRIPGLKSSGYWKDTFELCAAVCRTHRASTSHENSYISPRHHCFSRLGKPMLSPPLPANALQGVSVTLGAPGASCDATCQHAGGASCSLPHLPLLDTCDRLREAVACEAGCVAEAPASPMPYYADSDAPKADRPALCVVGVGGGQAGTAGGVAPAGGNSSYACAASRDHMRRLCPCVGGSGGGNGGALAASPGAPGSSSKPSSGSGDGAGGAEVRAEEEQQAAEEMELPGDDDAGAGEDPAPQQAGATPPPSGPASGPPAQAGADPDVGSHTLDADAAEDGGQETGGTARRRAARRRLLADEAPKP